MGNNPRKHHYIPQCYLKRFTSEKYLTVIAVKERKVFRVKPSEVAHIRDFFKVDVPEIDPDPYAFEKNMAAGEAQFDQVIALIESNRILPPRGSVELDILLSGFAKIYATSPNMRERLSAEKTDFVENEVRKTVLDEKKFLDLCNEMKIDLAAEGIDYEKVREFIEGRRYTIERDSVAELVDTLKLMKSASAALLERYWCLAEVDHPSHKLISSDCPVAIFGANPEEPDKGLMTLPISQGLLLIGQPNPVRFPRVRIDRVDIAINNTARFLNTVKYSFTPGGRILYIRDRKVVSSEFFPGAIDENSIARYNPGDESLVNFLKKNEKVRNLRKKRRQCS